MLKVLKDIKKNGKKFAVAGLAVVSLSVAIPMAANAATFSNANIELWGSATRPVIGNIRASGQVRSISTNNGGIRIRAIVTSRNTSGGTIHTTTTQPWQSRTAGANNALPIFTEATTGNPVIGTTRFGTARVEAQRRAVNADVWQQQLQHQNTW